MGDRLLLSGDQWTFAGFHGEDWQFRQAYRRDTGAKGWLPGTVPNSVYWDLLKQGEIPDPYFERNSRLVEWVSQRHWVYKRDFTVPADWAGKRLLLVFAGVDYEAEFYLDGVHLGSHDSMNLPARFDVTRLVHPGQSHHLAVVLRDAPREWGQLGRTSTVQTQKARFGYWWDFATRLVHLGIWQDVWLEATGKVALEDVFVRPRYTPGHDYADVAVSCQLDGPAGLECQVELEVVDPSGKAVGERRFVAVGTGRAGSAAAPMAGSAPAPLAGSLRIPDPALWWPNGHGPQPLYTCRVTVTTPDGVSDRREIPFGIRSFTLEENPWPPEDARYEGEPPLPYTFTVNGRRLFVKGWNWVPIDHLYGRPDLTERYQQLIRQAKAAGVNLLRVWGGGYLERELFYNLCDEHGIMVWQEFIQSSSGTDNVPPDDEAFQDRLEREADGMLRLRRNHPSLVLWCGGNELTDREKRPATIAQPALDLLARKVEELDPDRPFLPTSPSGPEFGCGDTTGQTNPAGMHDVHGPWHYRGPVDSYLPYNGSTALFHSEFGTQGAVAKSSLDRFMAPEHQWPPDDTNPNWVHHGAWWMQRHRVRELFGEGVDAIDEYLLLSQYLQTENLRYGVESNRRRWPVCSGTIIWQLNEPWPNSHCTTAVDYYLRPKMAYYYVKSAYAPAAASLRYEGPILADGALRATPFVVADEPFAGTLQIQVLDATGHTWHEQTHAVAAEGVLRLPDLAFPLPPEAPDVAVVILVLADRAGQVIQRNPYLFSRAAAPIFQSLRSVPRVALTARREDDRLVLRNEGEGYAFFPMVDLDDPRYHWQLDDNGPLLAPGEEAAIRLTLLPRHERADTDHPHGRAAAGPLVLTVRGWNTEPLTIPWEV